MEAIFQHLFEPASAEELPLQTLKEMAGAYPYFSPLQFLLSLRFKETAEPDFEKQYQKTLLHFQNPLWLKEQMNGWRNKKFVTEDVHGLAATAEIPQSSTADGVPQQQEPAITGGSLSQEVIADRGTQLHGALAQPESKTAEAAPAHQAEVQKEELPIFQAYHTVDYFASQGIKITADLLQHDKLGRQLKSFTEWLKTMKKLPGQAGEKQGEPTADPKILRFAESSLREREIITEAMAEVLLKQGKTAQAIDIYQKLSLLNPHKSAYFAARIEALKAV